MAMNVSNLDLNLLSVLNVVLKERSVTRAAKQLHVTQSAVSNSLARLREVFSDPLVMRSGRGLVMTPRAEQLAPIVSAAMAGLEAVFQGSRKFAPEETDRTFTLAAADNQQVCDVPQIAERFSRKMPNAKLRIVSPDFLVSSDGLAAGVIDAAMGPSVPVRPPLYSVQAWEEIGVLVVKHSHSRVKRRVSRELFNSLRHIDIEIAEGRTGIGHRLAQKTWIDQDLRREVALCVPSFTAAAMAAAHTEYVATIPRRTAAVFCRMLPIKIVEPDGFKLPALKMALIWHARTQADEGARYFRDLILHSLRAASSSGGSSATWPV